MNAINLLPWREEVRLKKLRFFTALLVLFLVLFTAILFFLTRLNQQFQQEKDALMIQQQNTQLQLHQITQQQQHLRQQLNPDVPLSSYSNRLVQNIWAILLELPFKNGELSEIQWKENLHLMGFCAEQDEFEQLQHFLKQHFSQQIQLHQFTPQRNGTLLFHFELPLGEINVN